jgi:hypothetical protein
MLGDALLRVGECLLQGLSDEEQIRLLLRILLCDVLIDRFLASRRNNGFDWCS